MEGENQSFGNGANTTKAGQTLSLVEFMNNPQAEQLLSSGIYISAKQTLYVVSWLCFKHTTAAQCAPPFFASGLA